MYRRIDGTEASLEEIRAALREAPLTALRQFRGHDTLLGGSIARLR